MDNSIFIINKQNKDRIAAWDLLKLFAIFFVLYGHCMQHLLDVNPQNNPMFLWICTFHMPLFMGLLEFGVMDIANGILTIYTPYV